MFTEDTAGRMRLVDLVGANYWIGSISAVALVYCRESVHEDTG